MSMDGLATQQRSALMGRIRSRNTRPGMVVRRLFHGLGYRYWLYVGSCQVGPILSFLADVG